MLTLLLLPGCADWGYQRIHIGQTPREYERVLPQEHARRTGLGLCYYKQDRVGGRTDTLLVLLAHDRRVAGKVWATITERRGGRQAATSYWLRGELDPVLTETAGAGPIDTLRAIAADLMSDPGEKLTRDAHALVVAGLVRLMERWPHVRDTGLVTASLGEALARVPAGGVARLAVDERGAYLIEYRQVAQQAVGR
ncbi:MAG: hypothetical protein KKB50_02455 [Planctomycetes bacterium]|nr:hypothetical protein [Planctomycetota bacterium]